MLSHKPHRLYIVHVTPPAGERVTTQGHLQHQFELFGISFYNFLFCFFCLDMKCFGTFVAVVLGDELGQQFKVLRLLPSSEHGMRSPHLTACAK